MGVAQLVVVSQLGVGPLEGFAQWKLARRVILDAMKKVSLNVNGCIKNHQHLIIIHKTARQRQESAFY